MENNNPKCWSELPQDLVMSVFERLSFAELQRAKSVCSSWYPASRQVVPKNKIPWLILFPKGNSSFTLFNPEEKDKLYKTQALGVEFANSVCLTTCGSWLLMQDSKYNLYMLNLFTRERIHLPAVESLQLGIAKVERTINDEFIITINGPHMSRIYKGTSTVLTPVFWIDEKTKHYVVFWGLASCLVVHAKTGDNLWSQVPRIVNPLHIVYKDHKLYSFSNQNVLRVYDFSGEIPQNIYQTTCIYPSKYIISDPWHIAERKVVVTLSGELLLVKRMLRAMSRIQSFVISKIYSAGRRIRKYEQIDSLGDEAMILDLGITVLANEVEGLKRNYIYFSDSHDTATKDLFLFNLQSRKMELLQKFDFDCLSFQLSARWFLPNFSDTFKKPDMTACSNDG